MIARVIYVCRPKDIRALKTLAKTEFEQERRFRYIADTLHLISCALSVQLKCPNAHMPPWDEYARPVRYDGRSEANIAESVLSGLEQAGGEK